jgi:hypothetical protein
MNQYYYLSIMLNYPKNNFYFLILIHRRYQFTKLIHHLLFDSKNIMGRIQQI